MTCSDVQSWISNYVDDALEEEHVGPMFAHLGSCLDCQRFLRSTLKIRSSVSTDARFGAPESLEDRVMKKVEGAHDEDRRRVDMLSIRISIPLPAAMAMAVMLVIGSMVISPLFFERPPRVQFSENTIEQLPTSLRTQLKITRILLAE